MMLNPSIMIDEVLSSAQATVVRTRFDSAWKEAAEKLATMQPEPAQPSPMKRRKTLVPSDDDDDLLNLGDDDEYDAPALQSKLDPELEKIKFRGMRSADWTPFLIDDGIRGRRLDLFRMFADDKVRSEYPTATLLFESKGSAAITEAHEERVFRFSKLTKSPLRSNLSPLMLEAFVMIKHNIPTWKYLNDGLDYSRLWYLFKKTPNTLGDHDKPGEDTDEDDENEEYKDGEGQVESA